MLITKREEVTKQVALQPGLPWKNIEINMAPRITRDCCVIPVVSKEPFRKVEKVDSAI